jgi:hypothetical protein
MVTSSTIETVFSVDVCAQFLQQKGVTEFVPGSYESVIRLEE